MQVCVQLPTSADSVALPAFAFARRAAAWLLLTAGSPAKRQSIDTSWSPGPQQQTRSSPCPSHGRAGGEDHAAVLLRQVGDSYIRLQLPSVL